MIRVLLIVTEGLLAAALLAAVPVPAAPARVSVDHVTFCGPVLAPMEQAFAEAGLPTVYGGPLAGGDLHAAILGFGDGTSIELLAPREANPPAGTPWRKAMVGEAGPCAWAAASSDIDRDLEHFRALRIRIGKAGPETRTNPDTTVARWRAASVGPSPPGSVLPLLIEDHTPPEARLRASPDAGAAGLAGVALVVVAVRRLDRSVALFRRAYGWGEPETGTDDFFGATLAAFPGEPVVLAAPRKIRGSWTAYRRKRFGDGPAAVLLAATDFDGAVRRFGLTGATRWFGKRVAWFPSTRLRGARVGVIAR